MFQRLSYEVPAGAFGSCPKWRVKGVQCPWSKAPEVVHYFDPSTLSKHPSPHKLPALHRLEMRWNFARSFQPKILGASFWYIALGMVCAVPLQGLAEKHCATGDLHSSQRGNDEIFCGAGFMNQKRPPEDPPTYPRLDLSGCDTHWANYGVPGDFLGEQHSLCGR
jgi:hypothetical protein